MDKVIEFMFNISFDIFGFKIDLNNFVATINQICDWSKIQSTGLWGIVTSVHSVLVPVGLSLLTLFFMIELIKKSLEVDKMSWERIAMQIVKFLLFKILVQNSYVLLSAIMGTCQTYFLRILPLVSATGSIDLVDILKKLVEGSIFEQIILFILIFILYIPFLGTIIGVLVQVFTRIGKLILNFALSPVPIAFGISEDQRNTCKAFLMGIVALGMEAWIVIICARIYAVGLGSIQATGISKMVAIMFCNGLFMALVTLGSHLSEKLTGGQ